MSEPLVLAIDGGNSKTDLALVRTDGSLVSFVRGSLSSPHHLGVDGCLSVLTLLLDEAASIQLRGKQIQIVGVDPRTYDARKARPDRLADPEAALRICLCHFPGIAERMPPKSFDLICAGHLHDGQIALPYPGGKIRFAHLRYRQGRGLLRRPSGLLHLSAGLGTTFVPFRFCARPEVTELHLRS